MPCMDNGPSPREEARSAQREAKWFESVVCGIFTHMESQPIDGLLNDILDNLDYEEMGVSRDEIQSWWHKHNSQTSGDALLKHVSVVPKKLARVTLEN